MSLKVKMILEELIKENRDYEIFSDRIIRSYIKAKYRCSTYLANRVIKELKKYDTKEKDM